MTAITTLEQELISLGHDVYVFTLETDDEYEPKPNVIRFSGIKVPLEGLKSYRLSFLIRQKVRVIKKYNLDVIHLHTEFSMAKMAVLASKKYNIPLVYTFHTLYEDYLQYISKTIDKLFHKKFLASLAKILISPINKCAIIKTVPTRKVLAKVSNYYLNGDIRVLPTGIDLKKIVERKLDDSKIVDLKKKLKIDDKFVFISIGRISEEKSLDVLVKAYSKIEQKNSIFVIVGDGPYLSKLRELIEELHLTDKVVLTGFVKWEEIVPYYQLGDVFLNASVTETQGLTYIESLACGTPMLVRNDECLDGVIQRGINGYTFDNSMELEEYVQKFIDNPQLVKIYKDKTLETILDFSKENFGLKVQDIYKEAIKNKDKYKRSFFTCCK